MTPLAVLRRLVVARRAELSAMAATDLLRLQVLVRERGAWVASLGLPVESIIALWQVARLLSGDRP